MDFIASDGDFFTLQFINGKWTTWTENIKTKTKTNVIEHDTKNDAKRDFFSRVDTWKASH